MRPTKLLAACFVLLLGAARLSGDYLEVRRSATIRAEPGSQSEILGRAQPGELLDLLNDGRQENGYYTVPAPSAGQEGFIFRTLVRRHRGDLPGAATGEATGVEASEFTDEERALIEEHVFGGLPSTQNVDVRQGYVRSYNAAERVPSWVAYHVIADYRNLPERSGRFSSFRIDREVSNPVRDGDYTGLMDRRGYARGHLAPYGVMGGDRDHDDLLAEADEDDARTIFQANFMSNIAPQHHAAFNGAGGLWFKLERWIQDDLVTDAGLEVWIFAGSVFGSGSHELVGPGADIGVPPMFFKIVVRQAPDEGDLPRILAFLFPHQRVSHGEIEDFLVSVDVVEALTGLDFFNELGADVQQRLEDPDTRENWDGFAAAHP